MILQPPSPPSRCIDLSSGPGVLPRRPKDAIPVLPLNQCPRAIVRDESGIIVPPEHWNDEQRRRQARASIIDQFRHGFQRQTLDEVRQNVQRCWNSCGYWAPTRLAHTIEQSRI